MSRPPRAAEFPHSHAPPPTTTQVLGDFEKLSALVPECRAVTAVCCCSLARMWGVVGMEYGIPRLTVRGCGCAGAWIATIAVRCCSRRCGGRGRVGGQPVRGRTGGNMLGVFHSHSFLRHHQQHDHLDPSHAADHIHAGVYVTVTTRCPSNEEETWPVKTKLQRVTRTQFPSPTALPCAPYPTIHRGTYEFACT